jgi:hypothetical protein
VSPKQLQPWAQVNHILGFKITHQVDINFPVGECTVGRQQISSFSPAAHA